ncbi:hypothetical protein BOTCAL_0429g00040 [Botryotinia calthae]|uniref:Uncharacterized protein n=1 Tax=Botryotinia calthae TaxID=38488 RepID=A0A4Y8CRI6_9HELO|nr:hypothetical protein BOTCAL_0429g00040 [Botryotinia calthae]
MTERFKSHSTCPSKCKTKAGELSVADHVANLCVGSTDVRNPYSEVPSKKTFPNHTTSSISLNSETKPPAPASIGHGVSPFTELDRHTSVAICDPIMADIRSIHSGETQGNLPSTLNSQVTPRLPHTKHDIDRNRVQTSSTCALPRKPLPNAIHVSDSTDFPVASSRNLKELEDEVHQGYEELRILKKEIVGLKDNERELHQSNQRHKEECSQAVRALQEMAFKSWKAQAWLPTDHDTVNLEISTLQAAMSGWIRGATSNDSRLDDLYEVFRGEDQAKHALKEELSKVMVFKNDMLPQGLPQRRAKKILLEALLGHHLFTNVFSAPFSFIGDESTSLDSIYRTGLSWNIADAHRWRSDTLRLLCPEPSEDEEAEAARLKMPALLDDRGKIQAENFIKSPARCFFVTTPEKTADLQKIYQQATGLAYHLWTRRSMLKIVMRKDLNSFFHIGDRPMALHTSVQEDIENTLIGQPISIVVYPSVVAYGLDECVDYETPRPWTPAIVWLHKPLSEKPQVPVGEDEEMKG